MLDNLDCYGLTDVGRVRPANEDQFLVADLDKSIRVRQSSLDRASEGELDATSHARLLVVADGMGGHASGERASSIAVDTLSAHVLDSVRWFSRSANRPDEAFLQELKSAFKQCQLRIHADAQAVPAREGMGTTVTMACIAWPKFYVAHVGDSRCYWLRRSRLRQITRDHTVAQQCVDDGTMTAENAKTSWLSNALWNVVGGPSDTMEPELYKARLQVGDTLLLCTDGLNKHVSDEEIEHVLNDGLKAREACERLVHMANEAGGTDNVTVVVARFIGTEEQKAEARSDSVLDAPVDKRSSEEDTLPLEDSVKM